MSGQSKRIPKNSIMIVIKFDSKEQVNEILQRRRIFKGVFQNH